MLWFWAIYGIMAMIMVMIVKIDCRKTNKESPSEVLFFYLYYSSDLHYPSNIYNNSDRWKAIPSINNVINRY